MGNMTYDVQVPDYVVGEIPRQRGRQDLGGSETERDTLKQRRDKAEMNWEG